MTFLENFYKKKFLYKKLENKYSFFLPGQDNFNNVK